MVLNFDASITTIGASSVKFTIVISSASGVSMLTFAMVKVSSSLTAMLELVSDSIKLFT